MKKFLVGLMSIFLVLGGGLLASCQQGGGRIELSSQSVEIELVDGQGQATVTASVSGAKEDNITLSCVGYENIIQASATKNASGQSIITIKGLQEGEGILKVSATGCQSKEIGVTVYSYITSMSQVVETGTQKSNYLVRGRETTLVDSNILSFQPSINSRRDIVWSVEDDNVEISGNKVMVKSSFTGEYITLKATDSLKEGISCDVTLKVLDDISSVKDGVEIKAGYGSVSALENGYYDVVSNRSEDDKYRLNITLSYTGDLEVTPIITTEEGYDTNKLTLQSQGKDASGYKFLAYANKDFPNLNEKFIVKFKIGYKDYALSEEIEDVLHVRVREVINEISLSDKDMVGLTEESTQTIYTNYAVGVYGSMVRVELKPTSVIDAEYTYNIRVEIPKTQMDGFENYGKEGFSPLQVKYKDASNIIQTVTLTKTADASGYEVYETTGGMSAGIVYLVSDSLSNASGIEGVRVTFRSVDEEAVYGTFSANLNRALGSLDNEFFMVYKDGVTSTLTDDYTFVINSNEQRKTVKKQFKVYGQRSVSGLHVKSNSKLVKIEDKLSLISDGVDEKGAYVIFEIQATLEDDGYGETDNSGTYEIYHDNGVEVAPELKSSLKLDIFLPLTDASIVYNTSNSASVVYWENGRIDLEEDEYSSSLNELILKNNSMTLISGKYNSVMAWGNEKVASPKIGVTYVDISPDLQGLTIIGLIERLASEDVDKITPSQTSKILSVTYSGSTIQNIQTKTAGKTFIIFTFVGKAEDGKTKTIRRIVKVESLVSVDSFILRQESDRNITLYASDTIADENEGQTKRTVTIYFSNSNVTYAELDNNFEFVLTPVGGEEYFKVENVHIGYEKDYIQFDIVALTTGGNSSLAGGIELHYQVARLEGTRKIIDIYTTIKLTILNAQRVEKVVWKNEREGGLEYNLGDSSNQYLVFDVTPTNAKNNELRYLPVDQDGNAQSSQSFVKISEISNNQIAVRVDTKSKIKGSLYVYPADMLQGGNIKYYYMKDSKEFTSRISIDNLGKQYNSEKTWFEFLTTEAYFLSYDINESGEAVRNEISFANILKKIDIIVVDGSSFEYSYKLYTADDFTGIQANKYYTLVNSVVITQDIKISEFNGGLQGISGDTTIEFDDSDANTSNLFGTLNGEVRNLTLMGNVRGSGFLCDVNNGKIENVTVDFVDQDNCSYISGNSQNTGGIAGENYGSIKNSSVLGLDMSGNGYVGGITGINGGSIEGCRVEFYKNGDAIFNSFGGTGTRAGLVGQALKGSSIENSYVYDYAHVLAEGDIAEKDSNGLTMPFIGAVDSNGTGEDPTIKNSFAVVGIKTEEIANAFPEGVTYKGVYNSYYEDGTYCTVNDSNASQSYFVSTGDDGFKDYVNGGQKHLKTIYQDEAITDLTSMVDKVVEYLSNDNNEYCKSAEYYTSNTGGISITHPTRILLMYYSLKDRVTSLTEMEQNDLNDLNTINLSSSDIAGINGLKFSSSSDNLEVIGTSIRVKSVSNSISQIYFYSRYDVSQEKSVHCYTATAFNGFSVAYGDTQDVANTNIKIQKTKTGIFNISLDKTSVYLGTSGKEFDLVTQDIKFTTNTFDMTENENADHLVDISVAGNVFTASVNKDSVNTKVQVHATSEGKLPNTGSTTKTFTITPDDGAISINSTEEEISLTPSVNGEVSVVVKTTKAGDSLLPFAMKTSGGQDVVMSRKYDNNVYTFSVGNEDYLNVTITNLSSDNDDIKTYTYKVTFEIFEEYKQKVDGDEKFKIYFKTSTNNESEILTLNFAKQRFTSIDVTNYSITDAVRTYDNGKPTVYYNKYTIGEKISTIAPGTSFLSQVSINPKYANYSYAEITYSGVNIADAVNIEMLERMSDKNYKSTSAFSFTTVGNAYRYIPKEAKEQIFFKVWINTTLEINTTLCFTITFFDSDDSQITYVNYYMDISYLQRPTITVDGESTTFLAKGSSVALKIQVLEDQDLNTLSVQERVAGISLIYEDEPVIDTQKGIKTYNATLSASTSATVDEKDNGIFTLKASVKRVLNGIEEIKYAVATVVLVDFKIDEDNILIGDKTQTGQVLTIWAGVPKQVSIGYNFIPESYSLGDNGANKLLEKRQKLTTTGYYKDDDDTLLVNYRDTSDKVNQTNYEKWEIEKRLFYIINGNEYALDDPALSTKSLIINENDNSNLITVTGNVKAGATLSMVLYTYVTANGVEKKIPTYFTIKIETFSDEDLPLIITDEDEFLALNPEREGVNAEEDRQAQDYILTCDLILENYTPFDTTYITSLDGNGYTIYIKSFAMPDEGEQLNCALFNKVEETTLLKNIKVNLYNGGQIKVNTSQYKDINVAGLVLENDGIITNCEVVAFYSSASKGDVKCTDRLSSGKSMGINLFLTDGENTSQEKFITLNSNFTVQLGGFALVNKGSITNSRVGGNSTYIITGDGQNQGTVEADTIDLEKFNIIGQGFMAGFVCENSGVMSACSVSNIEIENRSLISSDASESDLYLAGFVGINEGKIVTSYIEGVMTDENETARLGSKLQSKGIIAGFVYSNTSSINDCYSNILISSAKEIADVLYASGFVYKNTGVITNGFSASQIEGTQFTQMHFSGVDVNGNLLTSGTYENCYFYIIDNDVKDDYNDDSTESQFSTGALLISDPTDLSSFYGFAIASSKDDDSGIWRIVNGQVSLIEPDITSFSHRYILYVTSDAYEGVTREDEEGRYILPYAVVLTKNGSFDTALGSEINPIIIKDATDFVNVTGESTSTYVKAYFNNASVFGTYRLVKDINLSNVTNLPSTSKAFSGKLYGNGFTVEGLKLAASKSNTIAYGLFKSLEPINKTSGGVTKQYRPIVTNLTIQISGVVAGDSVMVGGLSGYTKDALIVGVNIEFNEGAEIVGYNFVGGVSGYAFGGSTLKNIVVTNPTTKALYVSNGKDVLSGNNFKTFRANASLLVNSTTFDNTIIQEHLRKQSYSGSVFGYVDVYDTAQTNMAFQYSEYASKIYKVDNIKVRGNVNSKAMVVGGAIGLTGPLTNINDVSVVIDGDSAENTSSLYAMYGYAGGVVGQAFGGLTRVYSQHSESVQDEIESNIYSYYSEGKEVERGILNLFQGNDIVGNENYTQKAIGGIVGYAGSGIIEIAYSRLNVTSVNSDYAGGIVGELSPEVQYTATPSINTSINTTYLIHEVYATGDVRSNSSGMAGGIIGKIVTKTPSAPVSLLSVNAYNFFTTYDYEKEENSTLKTTGNLSNLLKVNAFVGAVYPESGNAKVTGNGARPKYVKFEEGSGATDDNNGTTSQTISYYANYNFAGRECYFNLLDGYYPDEDELKSKNYTRLVSPSEFTTSESVHTQSGFLKSDAWMEENWEHLSDKLFPTIRHRENMVYLYLDGYNVATVFEKMKNKNMKVIVRGRVNPNDDECDDINLTQEKYQDCKIQGFYGILQGGMYKKDNGEDVKIIANQTFIESTNAGFTVKNLTVEFTGGELANTTTTGAGLFVNGTIQSGNIKGLTINLQSGVKFTAVEGGSVGIVASRIVNTNISNLNINMTKNSAQAMLTVDTTNGVSLDSVGVVAGELEQNSKISLMSVSGIGINAKSGTLITVMSSTNTNTARNAGGMFGVVRKADNSLALNMSEINPYVNTLGYGIKVDIKTATDSDGKILDTHIGGLIGYAEYVTSLSFSQTSNLTGTNVQTRVVEDNGVKEIKDVYIGGVIGCIHYCGQVTLGDISSVPTLISNEAGTYTNAMIGGLIGQINDSSVTINGGVTASKLLAYSSVDFNGNTQIGGLIGQITSSENNSTNVTFTGAINYTGCIVYNNVLNASATFSIGGVIGSVENANSTLTISGAVTIGTSTTKSIITQKYGSRSIQSIHIGGFVGYLDSATIDLSNNSLEIKGKLSDNKNTSTSCYIGGGFGRLNGGNLTVGKISGEVTIESWNASNKEKEDAQYVGGIIGDCDGTQINSGISLGELNATLKLYHKSTNLYAGGVIGRAYNQTLSSVTLGGALTTTLTTTQGATNLYAGGFAGQIASGNSTTIDLGSKTLTFNNTSNAKITGDAYIGGLVGKYGESGQTSQLNISSVKEVNFGGFSLTAGGDAYVGGLVGDSLSAVTITGKNMNVSAGSATEKSYTITSNTASIYYGGLVGNCAEKVTIKDSGKYMQIYKDSTSYDQMTVSDKEKVDVSIYYGGLVGKASDGLGIGTSKEAASAGGFIGKNVTIQNSTGTATAYVGGVLGYGGANTNIYSSIYSCLFYTGQVESKIKNIYFGGMVGYLSATNTNAFNSQYTVFGGALTISDDKNNENAEVYASGVVGATSNFNSEIDYSYNYGDIFVTYGTNLTALKKYCFGSLVGQNDHIGGTETTVSGSSNISLMTSHNSKYLTSTTNTVHSFVGEGKSGTGYGRYNHKVCLMADEQGTDVGYTVLYNDDNNYTGFSGYSTFWSLAGAPITEKYVTRLGTMTKNILYGMQVRLRTENLPNYDANMSQDDLNKIFPLGSKLNPATGWDTASGSTNGMTYRVFDENAAIDVQGSKNNYHNNTTYNNTALIYESNVAWKVSNTAISADMNWKSEDHSYEASDKEQASVYAPVNALTGYSYMAGFVVENNRVIESAGSSSNYAGLVVSGTVNTMVYACQTSGKIEVGGTNGVYVSGLVGEMAGKIFDCSTDIDIIYRAKPLAGGSGCRVFGLLGASSNKVDSTGIIENCYTGGTITTYSATDCFAIGYASAIYNTYSYTRFNCYDYVKGTGTQLESATLFSQETNVKNVCYDKDAAQVTLNSVTKTSVALSDNKLQGTDSTYNPAIWEENKNYNYGYPTLKYGYLKNSSYSKITASSQHASSGYDQYVWDITYTPQENGYTPLTLAGTNNYYRIPNATVWNKMLSGDASDNYILTNDIDLTNTSYKSTALSSASATLQGILDGQGHKINGLTTNLFKSVSGDVNLNDWLTTKKTELTKIALSYSKTSSATLEYTLKTTAEIGGTEITATKEFTQGIILNLNLTNAAVNVASGDSRGILAGGTTNAFISNVSVSGSITNTGQGQSTVAGLVGDMSGGHIVACTNLAKVETTKSGLVESGNDEDVGGIVGWISCSGGCISYCQNYGPIYGTYEDKPEGCSGMVRAGGIVGSTTGTTRIEYCYNNASILCGYAKPGATELSTINTNYYAGGIIARSNNVTLVTLTVESCWNAGMVTAGNKYVGGGKASYAAGIVADGGTSTTKINNSYNEGPIEALGQNPEWEMSCETRYTAAMAPELKDSFKVSIEFTTKINIYADEIYGANATINNCACSSTNNNVYLNGCAVQLPDFSRNITNTNNYNHWQYGYYTLKTLKYATISVESINFAWEQTVKSSQLIYPEIDAYGMPKQIYLVTTFNERCSLATGLTKHSTGEATQVRYVTDFLCNPSSDYTEAIPKNTLVDKKSFTTPSVFSSWNGKNEKVAINDIEYCFLKGKTIDANSSNIVLTGNASTNGRSTTNNLKIYGNGYSIILRHSYENIELSDVNILETEWLKKSTCNNNVSLYGNLKKTFNINAGAVSVYGWFNGGLNRMGVDREIIWTTDSNITLYGVLVSGSSNSGGKDIKVPEDFQNKGVVKLGEDTGNTYGGDNLAHGQFYKSNNISSAEVIQGKRYIGKSVISKLIFGTNKFENCDVSSSSIVKYGYVPVLTAEPVTLSDDSQNNIINFTITVTAYKNGEKVDDESSTKIYKIQFNYNSTQPEWAWMAGVDYIYKDTNQNIIKSFLFETQTSAPTNCAVYGA